MMGTTAGFDTHAIAHEARDTAKEQPNGRPAGSPRPDPGRRRTGRSPVAVGRRRSRTAAGAARQEGAGEEGTRQEGRGQEGARQEGPREGREEGARQEGARQEDSARDGCRPEAAAATTPAQPEPALPTPSASDITAAAKEAAAQAKSTVATAANPVSGAVPMPLRSAEVSRMPVAAAVAAGVLAILLVLIARRYADDD